MEINRQSFSWALIKPHARANRAIAAFLGRPVGALWPEWFDADGNRRTQPTTSRKAA